MSNNKRTRDESNMDKRTSAAENQLYHRNNRLIMNLLLSFILSTKQDHQDNTSQDDDVILFPTTTQELEDAKDTEISEAHQAATGMDGNELNYTTDPETSKEDGIEVSGDNEIDHMIDDFLNRFPDELDIYRRKGCSFMKHRSNEEEDH